MEKLFHKTAYNGIYRDDSLVIFNGSRSKQDIVEWLEIFQHQVNHITGYDGLQFTVSLWGLDKEDGAPHDKVSIKQEDFLPFLDMKLYWNDQQELAFDVFHKPGQQIKYLNSDSTLPPHMFWAIKSGVLKRLASLMTCDEDSEALANADLLKKTDDSPTLSQVLMMTELVESKKHGKVARDTERNHNVYFCIGFSRYSTIWHHPLHKVITTLKKCHFWMWYHRFPNRQDVFQSHLSAKILENTTSEDFLTRPCNCLNSRSHQSSVTSPAGSCPYGDIYRHPRSSYIKSHAISQGQSTSAQHSSTPKSTCEATLKMRRSWWREISYPIHMLVTSPASFPVLPNKVQLRVCN
jgi:hypothetical protein